MFEIDRDIRKARTLSSRFYTDEKYFELSKEKIFAASWQFVGYCKKVETLTPYTIVPGFLDEPVLIINSNGAIDCFSNVCTHRGNILVEKAQDGALIRCGYHGRRFSLDGKFLSMPGFEGVCDFPSEDDDLKRIPFAEKAGFRFASLKPVCEFEKFVPEVFEQLAASGTDELVLESVREYEINAHWALYCENYLEGFHIPYVHHGLNEIIDYGKYSTETYQYSSLQNGFDEKGQVAARYLFIFPNLMFNFYPWGISVNLVRPVSLSKTVVEFHTLVHNRSLMGKGAGADLHSVEMEDQAVVESVQKGINSRFYSQGRYSPTREQGTHHFHRLVAEFMV